MARETGTTFGTRYSAARLGFMTARMSPGEMQIGFVDATGGGGWGRAAERPAHLIARDIADGLVTAEAADRAYPGWRGAAAAE